MSPPLDCPLRPQSPLGLSCNPLIRGTDPPTEASTYDVFDRRGERVATILLDHGKRVVGFGEEAVYVVAFDALDLSYLERYAMPVVEELHHE